MSANVTGLAEGLLSVLTWKDGERLGSMLAPELVKAAQAALKRIEAAELGDLDSPWSSEADALREALRDAGVSP